MISSISLVDMDEAGDPSREIESICGEAASITAGVVEGASSVSTVTQSVKSCTPNLSTKKLCFPTIRSKPESRLAKAS